MGIMPYHVEIGSFMMSMQRYLNDGVQAGDTSSSSGPPPVGIARRLSIYSTVVPMLRDMAAGLPTPTLVDVLKNLFDHADQLTAAEAAALGKSAPASWRIKLGMYFMGLRFENGTWHHQEPGSGFPTAATGQLVNYFGNVERILASTLARAIEVSLGFDPGAFGAAARNTPVAGADQVRWRWPLSFTLVCEAPWFEGWVLWNRYERSAAPAQVPEGHVSVMFHTPGHGGQVECSPLSAPHAGGKAGSVAASAPYGDDALGTAFPLATTKTAAGTPAALDQGSWIITHSDHRWFGCNTTAPSGIGKGQAPLICFHYALDYNEVVTVSPAYLDGGVKP
jgi:hypothetical protein